MFSESDSLKKMRLPDGAVEVIAKGLGGPLLGGSVSDNGTILVSIVKDGLALYAVSGSGGEIKRVEVPALGGIPLSRPQFLPGGEDFLFVSRDATDDTGVHLATLGNGAAADPVLLMKNPTQVCYTPAGGGRILFVRDDVLYSQRLNRAARKLEGEPELLQRGVASSPAYSQANFSVSRAGTLAWRPGWAGLSQVTILDRRGSVVGTAGPPLLVQTMKLAPDEKHLLLGGNGVAWLLEPNQPWLLRVAQGAYGTVWSPDGSKYLESKPSPQGMRLIERPVNGSGEAHELPTPPGFVRVWDVSPDGRHLLFNRGAMDTSISSSRLDDAAASARVLVQSGESFSSAMFAPGGNWIVYHASSSEGKGGIYVQPFPGPGLRQQIAAGGNYPVWRKDGQEIVYLDQHLGKDYLWSVSVATTGGELRAAAPAPLFPVRLPAASYPDLNFLAVSRDGSRFYIPQAVEQPDMNVIHVKAGWMKP